MEQPPHIQIRMCGYLEKRLKWSLYIFFFTLFLFSLFVRVVRSYLLHYGYEDTLNSFDLAGKSNVPPISLDQGSGSNEEGRMYALSQRKVLRQLIRKGKIDAALGKLGEWYPDIVQVNYLNFRAII
ncbi:Ran-binding protein M-like [Vitis vinifera]|uniref:Ran-binding protein M-like n=1 Tax=Vitis vinifera TaxID=29760 RepID=A0A438CIW7_VITVI|nr:Ran-binding protein M-like [Vitis vinifera]